MLVGYSSLLVFKYQEKSFVWDLYGCKTEIKSFGLFGCKSLLNYLLSIWFVKTLGFSRINSFSVIKENLDFVIYLYLKFYVNFSSSF